MKDAIIHSDREQGGIICSKMSFYFIKDDKPTLRSTKATFLIKLLSEKADAMLNKLYLNVHILCQYISQ